MVGQDPVRPDKGPLIESWHRGVNPDEGLVHHS